VTKPKQWEARARDKGKNMHMAVKKGMKLKKYNINEKPKT
jgi:hypothetical protein